MRRCLKWRSWKRERSCWGHPDTLRDMGNLASTYRNQDCLKDAEVLEVEKRALGINWTGHCRLTKFEARIQMLGQWTILVEFLVLVRLLEARFLLSLLPRSL